MGMKKRTETPIALKKAEAYARIAEGYGLKAEITTEREPAQFYSSGEIMFPESYTAWIQIDETDMGILGETFYAGWRSFAPGQGRYATTRWIAGWMNAYLRDQKNFRGERDFASRLGVFSYKLAA